MSSENEAKDSTEDWVHIANPTPAMATFPVPFVPPNPGSWGPPPDAEDDARYANLPYAPFGRSDRLGRAADFTSSYAAYQARSRDRRRFGGSAGEGGDAAKNTEFQYKVDNEEEESFQLVDTSKAQLGPKRFVAPARRRQQMNRLRQLNSGGAAGGGTRPREGGGGAGSTISRSAPAVGEGEEDGAAEGAGEEVAGEGEGAGAGGGRTASTARLPFRSVPTGCGWTSTIYPSSSPRSLPTPHPPSPRRTCCGAASWISTTTFTIGCRRALRPP